MEEFAYVVNVDVAVHRGEEYLFIERATSEAHAAGLLGFPGGKDEAQAGADDVLEATARREVEEEVGVIAADPTYVFSGTFESDDWLSVLNVLASARYVDGRAHPREPEEVAAVYWLTPGEIRQRSDVPAFTASYLDAVEAHRGRRA